MPIVTTTSFPPLVMQIFDKELLQRPGLGDPEIYLSSMENLIEMSRKRYSGKKLSQCELLYQTFMEFYGWTQVCKKEKKMESKKKIPAPNFQDSKQLKYCSTIIFNLGLIRKLPNTF
jgi:hypothetical protein